MSSVQYKSQRYQIPPSHHSQKSLSSIRKAACKKFGLANPKEWTLSRPGKGLVSSLSQTMKEAAIPRNTHFKLVPNSNSSSSTSSATAPLATSSNPTQSTGKPLNSSQASQASQTSSNSASNAGVMQSINNAAARAIARQEEVNSRNKGSLASLRQEQMEMKENNNEQRANQNNSKVNKWHLVVQLMDQSHARHKVTIASTETLWNMLQKIEQDSNQTINLTQRRISNQTQDSTQQNGYLMPKIVCFNRTFTGLEQLQSTRLNSIDGLSNMSLLRLTFDLISDEPAAAESKEDSNEIEMKENKNNDDDDEVSGVSNISLDKMEFSGRHAKLVVQRTHRLDREQFEVPEDFYEIQESDFETILKSYRAPKSSQSSTKISDYNVTCLRVRLPAPPDGTKEYLQGYFRAEETVGDVRQFVTQYLSQKALDSALEFELYIAPPKRVLSDDFASLRGIGLVPAAIVNVKVKQSEMANLFEINRKALPLEELGAPAQQNGQGGQDVQVAKGNSETTEDENGDVNMAGV